MNFNWLDTTHYKVSRYGNDKNDGITLPFRTVQKALDMGATYIIIDNIIFRNILPNVSAKGINNAVWDNSFLGKSNFFGYSLNNLKILNSYFGESALKPLSTFYCTYKHGTVSYLKGNHSIFIGVVDLFITTNRSNNWLFYNNTIYKSYVNFYSSNYKSYFNIYSNSNIMLFDNNIEYSIFYNCLFKIGTETSYTALTGATEDDLRQNLEDRFAAQYPTSVNGDFSTCRFVDPKFNNPDLDDFTLAPDSPARTMSYFGTYIGAKDVGYPINIYANDLGHPLAFYNASAVNLDIADNSLKLTLDANGDAVGDGEIYTKPIDLEKTNQLIAPNLSFADAVRNQETVDSALDYDEANPISPNADTDTTQTLTPGELYYITGGSITLFTDSADTGTTYTIYEKIVVPADATGPYFTNPDTTTSPLLYHITNVRVGKTVKFRFKNSLSGTTVDNTGTLTAGTWYRVKGTAEDSITWNGLTVPVGDSFMATDTANTFTGTPVCEEMFTSSEAWCEVIVNSPIKCKRVGDVYSGAIDVGSDGNLLTNGNPDYFNDANYSRPEFDVYGQFIQYYVKVITNNMHI